MRRLLGPSFLLFYFFMGSVAAAEAQLKIAPLPVEEALHIRLLMNRPRRSPDGEFIAYAVFDSTKRSLYESGDFTPTGAGYGVVGCDVWISNIKTGEARNLTNGTGTSWSPVWSPDGRTLAFFSDRDGKARLWTWHRATDELSRVSDVVVRQQANLGEFRSWDAIQWTPDGKKILTKILPEGMSLKEAQDFISPVNPEQAQPNQPTVTVYSSISKAQSNTVSDIGPERSVRQKIQFGDLALIDLATGQVERIAHRVYATRYDLSPDGSRVAYLNAKGTVAGKDRYLFDLVIVSVADNHSKVLVSDLHEFILGMSLKWAPDSKHLAYVSGDQTPACFVVSIEGVAPQKVVDVSRAASLTEQGLPVWDRSDNDMYFVGSDTLRKVSLKNFVTVDLAILPGKTITRIIAPPDKSGQFWSPDGGQSVFLSVWDNKTKHYEIDRIDLVSRRITQLPNGGDDHSLAELEATVTDRDVVYQYADAQHPNDLWVARTNQQKPQRITHTNPVFDQYLLGQTRLIEWRNADGVKRQGAVLLPSQYKQGVRYPLIVWVYGLARLSNNINNFGLVSYSDNMHLLATRDYVVLLPDSSVSVGTPMADIAKNVLPGIDKLIDMGIADPDRLGVMGLSYGGYSALALIVQTARFKAAVCYAGISDMVSFIGVMDKDGLPGESSTSREAEMGGTLWQYRDRWIENSPIFYLDRVQTPLLLVHGSQDPVPAAQAEEVFIGLRRLGKEVEYAKYAGEGHGLTYYPNQVDYWKRVISWFDSHLKK